MPSGSLNASTAPYSASAIGEWVTSSCSNRASHSSRLTLSISVSSSSAAHHWALASASRTENEICDTLLKVGMQIPLDSHLDVASVFGRECVVCLTHHLADDLGGWGSASNRPHPFAGGVGHRSPITDGVGRGRQR